MIGIKLQGRLGNQLFQYAFIYCLAKKHRQPFYLLESEYYFKYNLFYFNLRPLDGLISKLFTSIYFRFKMRATLVQEVHGYHIPAVKCNRLISNVLYDGFFQSEQYFKDYKEELISLFTVKQIYRKRFLLAYQQFFLTPSIVVHYRSGDYGDWDGGDYRIPLNYYMKALSGIPKRNEYKLYVVSDDVSDAHSVFDSIDVDMYFSESEIDDFQIMQNADILIISNSTFAWWAAYLNHKNAPIFAPKYWLGFREKKEIPPGITQIDWNWIEF